jgi:hypothetical protein
MQPNVRDHYLRRRHHAGFCRPRCTPEDHWAGDRDPVAASAEHTTRYTALSQARFRAPRLSLRSRSTTVPACGA